jgi:hypothetical protein
MLILSHHTTFNSSAVFQKQTWQKDQLLEMTSQVAVMQTYQMQQLEQLLRRTGYSRTRHHLLFTISYRTGNALESAVANLFFPVDIN